jgi:hypothetical protein
MVREEFSADHSQKDITLTLVRPCAEPAIQHDTRCSTTPKSRPRPSASAEAAAFRARRNPGNVGAREE